MHSEGPLDGRVIGEIGVAMAVERLLRAGYLVAFPIVDDGYDLLAFDDRRCWRIQVKATASDKQDHKRIRITKGSRRRERYEASSVDAFVLVNTRTNVVACIPVAATNGRRWFRWAHAPKWQDMGVLRRIRTKRC